MLRAAPPDLRRLLTCVALTERGLFADTLAAVWRHFSSTPLPNTQLLATHTSNGRTRFTVTTPALRRAILETASDPDTHALQLHLADAMAAAGHTEYALDLASLYLDLRQAERALSTLDARKDTFSTEDRFLLQSLLRRAVTEDPTLLDTHATRAILARLLERGPDAVAVARCVAGHLPCNGDDCSLVWRVANVLTDAASADDAVGLLDAHMSFTPAQTEVHVPLLLLRAKIHHDLHAPHLAAPLERRVQDYANGLSPSTPAEYEILARLHSLRARRAFISHSHTDALVELKHAVRFARRSGLRHLQSALLGNLAAARAHASQFDLALKTMRRARLLKRSLGDLKGDLLVAANQARLHIRKGELLRALEECQDAVRRSARYGFPLNLANSLLAMCSVYDRLHRPRLALEALTRALQLKDLEPALRATLAWELAPLGAALGRPDVVRSSLRTSAAVARRSPRNSQPRAMFALTAARAAMHLGHRPRMATMLRRAARNAGVLPPEDAWNFQALRLLADPVAHRTAVRSARSAKRSSDPHVRYLFATLVWFRRYALAARTGSPYRPPMPRFTAAIASASTSSALPGGAAGRMAAELSLAAARLDPGRAAATLLTQAELFARHGELRAIAARVHAVWAVHAGASGRRSRAQLFSTAVSLLDDLVRAARPVVLRLPDEFAAAVQAVDPDDASAASSEHSLDALHALAHRLLRRNGGSAQPDARLTTALRRVLHASGQLRREGDLRDFLQTLAEATVEITSAERACAVLADCAHESTLWVASCAGDAARETVLRDLSRSVIGQVMATGKPQLVPFLTRDAAESDPDIEVLKRSGIAGKHSIICVPIVRRGVVLGVMYADSASMSDFDVVDQEVLTLFAEQVGAAIETNRLVADLEQSVAQLRTLQDRFVQGERLRVLGEVSAGVAHEFNNYLTAILARIQMLTSTGAPEGIRQDLLLVQRAAEDAAAVVGRLQTFSRRKAQQGFALVDLTEVCRDAVALLQPLWKARAPGSAGPRVQTQLRAPLHVLGNATELREIVTNLVRNALDAVGATGRIHVSVHRRGRIAEIKVRDNGHGMPPDVLARAMEPFFTTKGERGTGLGLALCGQIAEQHGGTVDIWSREGTGTIVRVTLPIEERAVEAPARAAPPSGDPGEARRVKVLFVDDDRDVLESVARFLSMSGLDVTHTGSPKEAIRLVTECSPDILLTDFNLGDTTGIELAQAALEARPDLPVALITGYSSVLDAERARAAGVDVVIAKPPNYTLLAGQLSALARAGKSSSTAHQDTRP